MPFFLYHNMRNQQEWEPWMVYVMAGVIVAGIAIMIVVFVKDRRWWKKHGVK